VQLHGKLHQEINLKDFKKLLKKFRTLEDDLRIFVKNQLNLYHKLHKDNKGIFPITGLSIEYPGLYKAKKFACKSLKGKAGAGPKNILGSP